MYSSCMKRYHMSLGVCPISRVYMSYILMFHFPISFSPCMCLARNMMDAQSMLPSSRICLCVPGGVLLLVASTAFSFMAVLASFAVSLGTALLVHLSGQTLSWYTSSWLLVPLYFTPSLMGTAAVHLWWKNHVSDVMILEGG